MRYIGNNEYEIIINGQIIYLTFDEMNNLFSAMVKEYEFLYDQDTSKQGVLDALC